MLRKTIGWLVCSIAVVYVITPVSLVAKGKSVTQMQSNDQEAADLLIVIQDRRMQQQEPDRFIKAIERLGEMQSEAAIPFLIKLLTFSRTFSWENRKVDIIDEEHPVTILGRYPAAGALFHIGQPALAALVRVIEVNQADSLASQNAEYTVKAIFREDPKAGVQYLRGAADRSQAPEASKKLREAAERANRSLQ